MDRSRVLTLVGRSYQTDPIGQPVPADTETRREVFCNVSSVTLSELETAGQMGFRPEYRVTLFAYDYEGEPIAELDGVRYGVYRTYLGKNESVDLYLERKAGV